MSRRLDGLPNPASTEACYLAAVLEELQALRADLAKRRPEPKPQAKTGMVELREPKAKRKQG